MIVPGTVRRTASASEAQPVNPSVARLRRSSRTSNGLPAVVSVAATTNGSESSPGSALARTCPTASTLSGCG